MCDPTQRQRSPAVREQWLGQMPRCDLPGSEGTPCFVCPGPCREARHPYLAEDVIATALSLPLHQVADLRLPPGQGDKLVLRRCLLRLGLHRAEARVKRAIQFGSRIGQKSNLSWFGGTRHANRRHAGTVKLTCDGLGAQPD